ncbi:MAG: trypsin-like serine protease [Bacteriovoracaceae bacterium]|nr:trypsin-like serine protease [Bacteriovoracaceae bacterium]
MKNVFCLWIFLSSWIAVPSSFAIVNGYFSSYVDDAYDSTVLITFNNMVLENVENRGITTHPTICTGTIVNDTTVLTAAHCVSGFKPGSVTEIQVHGVNRDGKSMYIRMGKIIIHPDYVRVTQEVSNRHINVISNLQNYIEGNLSDVSPKDFFSQNYQAITNYEYDLKTQQVPYDLALLKVMNPDSNRENFFTFQKGWVDQSRVNVGELVTLAGFGNINNTFKKMKANYEVKLRMGKNDIYQVSDQFISLLGTSTENDGSDWKKFLDGLYHVDFIEFNSDWDSSPAWGDSGGPLAVHGSYAKRVIGVASTLSAKDLFQTLLDPTHKGLTSYYVNLNGSVAQNFLKKNKVIQ